MDGVDLVYSWQSEECRGGCEVQLKVQCSSTDAAAPHPVSSATICPLLFYIRMFQVIINAFDFIYILYHYLQMNQTPSSFCYMGGALLLTNSVS